MSDEPVITIQGVSKAYRLWDNPASRLTAPLLEAAGGLLPGNSGQWLKIRAAKSYRDFWALKNVSFEVNRGEAVGIIGRNGSGKSTLLQIIAGTLQPTEGTARGHGRVGALLELGSGFNHEFTGRENVYLSGAVLGLPRAQVDARFDAIAAFADIGDFLDQPVKTYSSGMMIRLAFAVQTAVEPDILIIDEALSVGDFFFQQKCAKRMRALREAGTTLLFVSHDMASVRDLCQRVLYLRKGQSVFWGEAQNAIALYHREDDSSAPAVPAAARAKSPQIGTVSRSATEIDAHAIWKSAAPADPTGAPSLLAVAVFDSRGQPGLNHRMGESAVIHGYFQSQTEDNLNLAVEIKNRQGQLVSSLGSRVGGQSLAKAEGGQVWQFEVEIQLGLEAGQYSFQVCLGRPQSRPNIGVRVAETPWLGPLAFTWDYASEQAPFLGMFNLPAKFKFTAVNLVTES